MVDAACILWSPTGACAFYDNDAMRYNLYGVNIGCRALGILILSAAVIKSWNMRTWSGNAKDETPEVSENDKKLPEAHNLMEKYTLNSKR